MIDLIIPVYKNKTGLRTTLESVNFNVFNVTVVEDGSNEIHGLKWPVKVIKQKNTGPGQARQRGINETSNPYIMFIDAGDVFTSKEVQEKIAETIAANPSVDVFQWQYYYKDKLTGPQDNRLHGKVYKRVFLKYHGITFSKAGSYLDEDIGFNRTCRLILRSRGLYYKYIEEPVIKWVEDRTSVTQKDGRASLYRDQTKGLALNSIHCLNICGGKVNDYFLRMEINEIACALYYWFIQTALNRPEFLNDAWQGAKIFFDRYGNKISPADASQGSKRFIQIIKDAEKLPFHINLIRFINDIHSFKNVPKWYCGK